jgi:hypothetical protein
MKPQHTDTGGVPPTPHRGARHRTDEKVDLQQQQEAPDDERRDTDSHANDIKRADPTDNQCDRTGGHENDSDEDAHARG